eukprot:TRINITY_DN13372_c0_g1_i1.p1 TRINITY_DN13372_c0_g1~~TRINITY_DN13372_c0_g1_i1.p1  ORF type:complete len:638 (+),score=40.25 TRINITY_DN13372_c0_g1_i1:35-1915(+)
MTEWSPGSKRKYQSTLSPSSMSGPGESIHHCISKPHVSTPEHMAEQRASIEKWRADGDLANPPAEVVLRERPVIRVIRQIIGGKRHNALPMVEMLCRRYSELEEIRSFVSTALDTDGFTQLSSLCHELSARIDRSRAPEEAKVWARFFQKLAGYQILCKKGDQLSAINEYSRTKEIPKFLDMLSNLVSRPIKAIQEITERTGTPVEAFFEMIGSMTHILKTEMDRLHILSKPATGRMFEKAFHSTREAVLGSRVLEVPYSLSVWGSARSLPCYDLLSYDCSYTGAEMGFSIKTGGGPGTMDAALAGGFKFIMEQLKQGIIPNVETFGLVGNFVKLNEKPSFYMTYRVDHHDLDIRKMLLRTNALVMIFPGRLGTDEELYAALVELITDYYNTADNTPCDVSTVVIVGEYQRDLLLRHILVETNKIQNAHIKNGAAKAAPLFYFVPVDTAKLVSEYSELTSPPVITVDSSPPPLKLQKVNVGSSGSCANRPTLALPIQQQTKETKQDSVRMERLEGWESNRLALHSHQKYQGSEHHRVYEILCQILASYQEDDVAGRVDSFAKIKGVLSSVELQQKYKENPTIELGDIAKVLEGEQFAAVRETLLAQLKQVATAKLSKTFPAGVTPA